MKPILVIGSTCVDVIINIDHLPVTGEDIHPTGQSMSMGGCAYNVAHTIRLLGSPCELISPVGGGPYGEFVYHELEKQGYEIPVHLPGQDNGCCYCLVEASGERTFMSCHGVEYTFRKEWMQGRPAGAYAMVYVCGLEIEEKTGGNLIEYLEANPALPVFFAPGPRGPLISRDKLSRMYALHPILHVNEDEAYALSGRGTVAEAAGELMRLTGNAVVITLGKEGACCLERDGSFHTFDTTPAQVADTIGAGDSHAGTILACLCRGVSLTDAITAANRVSRAVVEIKGAQLRPDELQAALAKG